ncbi:cobalamin B12-binding domain-containing protein [Parasphingorhabdus sp. JC815]|uniref:cobalamin B12-binding domain-containing protein n=1 Tax=Parasphingorhabdus sp. JC815 TaxID=3232140 RepID=UPI00345A872D
MGRSQEQIAVPVMDRHEVRQVERYFVEPEIYARPDVSRRQANLARFVSGEIVPRLLRLHTEVVPDAPPAELLIKALRPNSTDVGELAKIVLGDDLAAATSYVTVMRDRGLSIETLYTQLLEPTARCLGRMWENDECDFIDVTIGVGRLQLLLSTFNETCSLPELATNRRFLIAAAPGNQHVFGASMIEKLLSAGGWQVQPEYSGDPDQIEQAVRSNWFAVVGLTAGSDLQLEDLKSIIADVRKQSQNRAIGILVGGPIFIENPTLAVEVGADATASNAPAAVLAAQRLFDAAVQR